MDGGHVIARCLKNFGVPHIATLCGGHISSINYACEEIGIRTIGVRDEGIAGFIAFGTSVLTGIPGVCDVTAGPGVGNVITAIETAAEAGVPMVVLGGAAPILTHGRGALQDRNQIAIARAAGAKVALRVTRRVNIPWMLSFAFNQAQAGIPGPVFLEFPLDMLTDETHPAAKKELAKIFRGCGHGIKGFALRAYVKAKTRSMWEYPPEADIPKALPRPHVKVPSRAACARAIQIIASSKRPILILGTSAIWSEKKNGIADIVERLGIPVFSSGLARGLVSSSSELVFHQEVRKPFKEIDETGKGRTKWPGALKESDCVILAGAIPDFRLNYGTSISRTAQVIRIGPDAKRFSRNIPRALTIKSDIGIVLGMIEQAIDWTEAEEGDESLGNEHLRPTETVVRARWSVWLRQLREWQHDIEALLDSATKKQEAGKVNPFALCATVQKVIRENKNSVVVMDGGDFVGVAAKYIESPGPCRWLDAGPFGTLGAGAGFALAAKAVYPDAEVWGMFGDGAFGWTGYEISTAMLIDLPFFSVIGNDGCWSQIARADRKLFNSRQVAVDLGDVAYEHVAGGMGGVGIVISNTDDIKRALENAVIWSQKGRPVVINAKIGSTEALRKDSLSV